MKRSRVMIDITPFTPCPLGAEGSVWYDEDGDLCINNSNSAYDPVVLTTAQVAVLKRYLDIKWEDTPDE